MSNEQLPNEIRGLLLPVGDRCLLLPSSAVAEVLSFEEPKPIRNTPDWLLGRVDWRGHVLPLCTWERAVENREPDWNTRRIRMAVLNTLNGNQRLPYMVLLSIGIARLIRIHPNHLSDDLTNTLVSPWLQAAVMIAGQPAWIPNLDEWERALVAYAPFN